jgi:hypothetical protein
MQTSESLRSPRGPVVDGILAGIECGATELLVSREGQGFEWLRTRDSRKGSGGLLSLRLDGDKMWTLDLQERPFSRRHTKGRHLDISPMSMTNSHYRRFCSAKGLQKDLKLI